LSICKTTSLVLAAALILTLASSCVYAQTPFTLYVNPNQITLGTESGFTDIITVTVLGGEGFNGTVNLSYSGAPEGVTAKLRDYAGYITSASSFTTYLQLTSSPAARPGKYTLTLAATSQEASSFYAVANQVNLVIQEVGQPHITDLGAQTTNRPIENPTQNPLLLVMLAGIAGLAVGSAATLIITRRKSHRDTEPKPTSKGPPQQRKRSPSKMR
jgi:hypothetical protein